MNASKLPINQQEQTKQDEKNDLKTVFIKKNKNWYKIILHEIKNLQIKKINKLITCE